MTKTSSSRRISSAMASRRASRTVVETISVPAGMSGSAATSAFGAAATGACRSPSPLRGGSPASAGGVRVDAGCASPPPAPSARPPPCEGEIREPALSPSCSNTAMTALTFTPSAPAGTTILPSTPSSTASTSIVALSVSISAITSPATILSPSFFSHLERLPSSIVGDRAGIRISIGMTHPPSVYDVGPKLGRIRLRIGLGKIRRVGDDVAHLLVDRLELVLRRPISCR